MKIEAELQETKMWAHPYRMSVRLTHEGHVFNTSFKFKNKPHPKNITSIVRLGLFILFKKLDNVSKYGAETSIVESPAEHETDEGTSCGTDSEF